MRASRTVPNGTAKQSNKSVTRATEYFEHHVGAHNLMNPTGVIGLLAAGFVTGVGEVAGLLFAHDSEVKFVIGALGPWGPPLVIGSLGAVLAVLNTTERSRRKE